jgi:hypothetical protein
VRVVAQGQQEFQAPPSRGARSGELCVTPCVVDMPPGTYTLYMRPADGQGSSGDVDQLAVSERLTYYLRAPGRFEHPTWVPAGPTLISTVGLTATTIGFLLLLGGSSDARALGWVLAAGGLTLSIGGGIFIYEAQRGKIQKGATTTWSAPLQ